MSDPKQPAATEQPAPAAPPTPPTPPTPPPTPTVRRPLAKEGSRLLRPGD